jgi:tetratricopeptide (TPR) repeat protein
MICPKCAKELNKSNFCDSCNIEVKFYQKIKNTSNWLYNQGLQKAKVRDLTGAIDHLKRSLKFNKRNTDARNLLGLIYFEIGEVVLALEQWVISKSFKLEDNVAERYINEVQANQHKLAQFNTAIKKYNQALGYIDQNSLDLAVLQLKKVISINPNFVRAYALLSLLYIHLEENDKAKKNLLKILTIDKNNYTALKYYESLVGDHHDYQEETLDQDLVSTNKKNWITVFSENPYIYQILYVLIGIVIGASFVAFLMIPTQVSTKNRTIENLKEENKAALAIANEERELLQEENQLLKTDLEDIANELEAYEGQDNYLTQVEHLQKAVEAHLDGDKFATADALYLVEEESLTSVTSQNLYNRLKNTVYKDVGYSYYIQGYNHYQGRRFEEAVNNFTLSLRYAPEGVDAVKALYFRGRSYQEQQDTSRAIVDFEEVINRFPNSPPYTGWSRDYINVLSD